MFKIRMQGQYGGPGDKKLGRVVGDMWREFGLRDGIMRGYWVSPLGEGKLQEARSHQVFVGLCGRCYTGHCR
jgi:hypothetical protein